MNKYLFSIYICAFSTFTQIQANPYDYERVYWDRGDARKVIRNAMYIDHGAFGELLGAATLSGLGETGAVPKTLGIWLTDDVCWALGVVFQHEERRTDDEKVEVYEDCRADADKYYTIYVSASWELMHQFFNTSIDTQIDTHRSGQIFLQRRKNKDRFLRPAKIVAPPDYMHHFADSVGLGAKMAMGRKTSTVDDVLIMFPRDESLLEGQKDIDLELRQDGNRQRLKFSLKRMRANKGRLEGL